MCKYGDIYQLHPEIVKENILQRIYSIFRCVHAGEVCTLCFEKYKGYSVLIICYGAKTDGICVLLSARKIDNGTGFIFPMIVTIITNIW